MNVEFLVLIAGIIGGICSSAPFGIINLWITNAVLTKNEQKVFWFIGGVILADGAHAAMATWGYHEFLQKSGFERWIGIFGGLFVIAMGALGLKNAKPPEPEIQTSMSRKAHEFTLGLMMCGLNPGFLVFWMFVIDQIESKISHQIEGLSLVNFLLGLVLGDLIWFSFIIGLAKKGRDHVHPRMLQLIRVSIALLFIIVGLFAVYKSAFEPDQKSLSFVSFLNGLKIPLF